MGIEIIGHFTCPTTYRLVKRLIERGLVEKVSLRDSGTEPIDTLARGVVSVPSVFIGDRLYFSGVMSTSEVVDTISRGAPLETEEYDFERGVELLRRGYLDSSLIALYVFVHDDIERPFVFRDFIEAVSRLVFYRHRSVEDLVVLRKRFLEYMETVREVFEEELVKTVAKIIARDVVQERWPERDTDLYFRDREQLAVYITGRASLGRVGMVSGYRRLLERYRGLGEKIERLYRHLEDRWTGLVDDVYREYESILRDREYVETYWRKTGLETLPVSL